MHLTLMDYLPLIVIYYFSLACLAAGVGLAYTVGQYATEIWYMTGKPRPRTAIKAATQEVLYCQSLRQFVDGLKVVTSDLFELTEPGIAGGLLLFGLFSATFFALGIIGLSTLGSFIVPVLGTSAAGFYEQFYFDQPLGLMAINLTGIVLAILVLRLRIKNEMRREVSLA